MGARSESLYRGGVVGDRVEAKRLREISTISGPILGKLPDRPISTFESQDMECDSPDLAIRLVSTESARGWEKVVDPRDKWMKPRQTA